ncbi:MAG TPA: glycosyltransferase 87 family protein [Actinomycetota bacterium]|nr:glycosyltransferase 87 family protein [Actinomycetota bacterium]
MSERRAGLGVVLVAAATTMLAGWVLKAPCLGPWADGRQYNRLCYSDVVALYHSEDRDRGLDEDRVPYIDGENEYPVLTGVTMWLAALPATSYASFFNWTAVLLMGAALATASLLFRVVGDRALFFALAPTLLIYGLVNWDLLAVALATAGTAAFLRGRDAPAGAYLGAGAAAKLYPGLLALPFALDRLGDGRRRDAIRIVAAAAAVWAAINLPLALFGFDRWSEFFTFNSARTADWDSVWFFVARHLDFTWDLAALNALTAGAFAAAVVVVWVLARRRRPRFPPWTFGFPLLVAFLLTGKVYSPQYGLWLLPWFALTLPNLRLFVAFELADIAVFVTRFQFFAGYADVGPGLPFWAFETAVLVRAAVLIACVVAWIRTPTVELNTEPDAALLREAA